MPEELGGLGLGMLAKVVVWSEVSRTTALPARHLSLFGFPVSLALGFWLGLGPAGLWWGFVAGLAAVAALLLARVRSRLRRSLTRVRIDASAQPAGT